MTITLVDNSNSNINYSEVEHTSLAEQIRGNRRKVTVTEIELSLKSVSPRQYI